MKTLWGFVLLAWVAAVSALGQGSVNFGNSSASRVYYYEAGTFTFIPPGPQFSAELMYAPDGTPAELFDVVAIRVGASVTFGAGIGVIPGIFQGGGRTVNSITPAGGFGLFQVRVWETAFGTDYRSMIASGNGQAGTSAILRVDTGDPTTVPPGTPTLLTSAGLASFCVTPASITPPCVPEPSSVVIGIAATAVLLFFRRRARA